MIARDDSELEPTLINVDDMERTAKNRVVSEKPSSLQRSERIFTVSMIISGIRCSLTYVVLPFLMPFIGLAADTGHALGIVLGLIAIAANVYSMQRFWRVDHRLKKPVTVLHTGIIGLLVVLVFFDIVKLLNL